MTYSLNPPTAESPLEIASKNYWASRTGREYPPSPTYRAVESKERFGRYMDPYGCQEHMDAAKGNWRKFYLAFYGVAFVSLIAAPIDWFVLLFVYPILGVFYFLTRNRLHGQYSLYKRVQDQITATGEPQWVPYDKLRLRMIEHNPRAILP
jgi:hypothetical protein